MRRLGGKILSYILPVVVLTVTLVLLLQHGRKREVERTDERLIAAIVELSVAQKMFMQLPESYDSAREEILARNGFSRQDLETLKQTYREDPERWVTIWRVVVKRLEELQQQQRGKPREKIEKPEIDKGVEP